MKCYLDLISNLSNMLGYDKALEDPVFVVSGDGAELWDMSRYPRYLLSPFHIYIEGSSLAAILGHMQIAVHNKLDALREVARERHLTDRVVLYLAVRDAKIDQFRGEGPWMANLYLGMAVGVFGDLVEPGVVRKVYEEAFPFESAPTDIECALDEESLTKAFRTFFCLS